MKIFFKSPILATVVTFASMVYEYPYCMGGMGRGFPFAILKPAHHNDPFAIQLDHGVEVHGLELSFTSIFFNILIYLFMILHIGFVVGGLRNLYTIIRLKRKKTSEQKP